MQAHASPSWKELLANPGPEGHIVQLYQDADFYGEAISHFAAEGFARGESIILVATAPNWDNISARLTRKGFELEKLFRRGQLTVLDAEQTLPKFLAGNMPDPKIFKPFARATIEKARVGGKFPRVRWWGEMVNVLYVNGNARASTRMEEFFDDIAHEQSIAVFCSFLMDKYDRKIYDGAFGDICRTHAHVIPAEDYDCHHEAVNRAIADVIGAIQGPLLRSLVSWKLGTASTMPISQALLLWVKDAVPKKFEDVLFCARKHEAQIVQGGAPHV